VTAIDDFTRTDTVHIATELRDGGEVAPYIVVNMPSSDGSGWLVQTARGTSGYSALIGRVICANVP
jgi:hypothetical protein